MLNTFISQAFGEFISASFQINFIEKFPSLSAAEIHELLTTKFYNFMCLSGIDRDIAINVASEEIRLDTIERRVKFTRVAAELSF